MGADQRIDFGKLIETFCLAEILLGINDKPISKEELKIIYEKKVKDLYEKGIATPESLSALKESYTLLYELWDIYQIYINAKTTDVDLKNSQANKSTVENSTTKTQQKEDISFTKDQSDTKSKNQTTYPKEDGNNKSTNSASFVNSKYSAKTNDSNKAYNNSQEHSSNNTYCQMCGKSARTLSVTLKRNMGYIIFRRSGR